MGSDSPLVMGMFWGGLVMAAVPVLFSLGVGIFVIRRHLLSRRQQPSEESRRS